MAGRLSKEKKNQPIDPQKQAVADEWMKTIGEHYEEIKEGCRINALKQNKDWSEDVFSDSIVLCYECICRNSLKDTSVQGCKNYLFNAYRTNIIHDKVIPFNARRVDNEEIVNNYDPLDEREGEKKVREQLFNDFAVVRILELAEANCDPLSFYCYRLKFLMDKMPYQKLVKITKIKSAKARVKSVIEWIKENVTEDELRQEFEDKFGI